MIRIRARPRPGPRAAPRRSGLSLAFLAALALVGGIKVGVVVHDAVRSTARAPNVGHAAEISEPSRLEPSAGPEERAWADDAGQFQRAGADRTAVRTARLALDRLSRSEIEVLQQLAARRAELDERAQELDRHAALLATAEANLKAQVEQLEKLRAEVAAMMAEHDAAEEAKLASLVKIYENMKPKAAAEIFDRLEMPVLIGVLQRMRAARSADVLARMDPAKARQVTAELARRAEALRPPSDS